MKVIERVIRSLQERMRHLPGFAGFNEREYKPEVLNDFLRRVSIGKEHPGDMFLGMSQIRDAIDTELMAFAAEPQNGRMLPGVSPEEAWLNGIGGFPGVKDKPLRKLGDTTRYLLSTHRRVLPVTEKGVRFEVGGKPLVFWGDALLPYKHKSITVRWNIEEPELLHCLPPGDGAVFTMKCRELGSWRATREELEETGAARNRWIKHGKTIFDQLPHKLVTTITRDAEHSDEVHAAGAAILADTAGHREGAATAKRQQRRRDALAGALGIRQNVKNPERAIAAAQRLQALYAQEEVNP